MPRPILFLTRSWHGTGGMQRLSRDLARELNMAYGDRFVCIHPNSRGLFGMLAFCVRAMMNSLNYRPSHIHLGDASLLSFGALLKKLSHARLSVTACGLDVTYKASWYQFLLHRGLPFADRIVCISTATATEVKKRTSEHHRILVIPCGVTPQTYKENHVSHDLTLLTIGRLIPRKGVAWFVENVFPVLSLKFPGIRYVIIGSGPEEAHIREILAKNGMAKHVVLRTDCSDDDCAEAMRSADLFIMPNIPIKGDIEGFGIVCIEAANLGLPVAAAKLEGVADSVIENKTGKLYEAENAAACIDVIRDMIDHPLDRKAVADAAREAFSWKRIIQSYQSDVFTA